MSKILPLLSKTTNSNTFRNIINGTKAVINLIFYLYLIAAIIIVVSNIFYIQIYPFALKVLILSSEIIILMILLYWGKQRNNIIIYRILWILLLTNIFLLMLKNLKKFNRSIL